MPEFTLSIDVAAPVERTFAVFSDIPDTPRTLRGVAKVEMLSSGPVELGTRWRETRLMMGKEATEELEISSFERGSSYEVSCDSFGTRYRTRFAFQPTAGGTRVDVSFRSQPLSLAARLLSPLGWAMMGTFKKCIREDLEDLKVAAEAG